MSIIFQLFSVADLARLNTDELNDLRNIVGDYLDISNEVADIPSVQKRAKEVLDQLKSIPPRSAESKETSIKRMQREIPNLKKLLGQEDQQIYDSMDKERQQILAWAIFCELIHSDEVLAVIKKATYKKFKKYTKEDPIGSDVFYQHEP